MEVKQHLITEFQVPTISICFDVKLVLNLSRSFGRFDHFRRDYQDTLANETLSELQRNKLLLSLKDELIKSLDVATQNELTSTFNELVPRCLILSDTSSGNGTEIYADCSINGAPDVYFHHIFKCFTLFKPGSQAIISTRTLTSSDDVLLSFSTNYRKHISIHLDGGQEYLTYQLNNWLNLDLEYYHFMRLSYSKSQRILLPDPYDTQCIDYPSIGFTSRADCIRNCNVEKFIDEMNIWPKIVPAPITTKLRSDYNVGKYKSVNIEKYCIDSCGGHEDCVNVDFVLRNNHRIPRDPNSSGHLATVELLVQKGLEKTFIHHPKLNRVELFSYVASSISLWFGFSVMHAGHNKLFHSLQARSTFD